MRGSTSFARECSRRGTCAKCYTNTQGEGSKVSQNTKRRRRGCAYNNGGHKLRNEAGVTHGGVGVFVEEGGDEFHGVEGGVSQGLGGGG